MPDTLKTVIELSVDATNDVELYLGSDDFLKNIEYFLYSLLILNGINKKSSEINTSVTTINPIKYNKFPISPPSPNLPTVPEDQLDIRRLLEEVGNILASYGYALANNIPVSINRNFNRVNYDNSYGTLIALSRRKAMVTRDQNYDNSDINLPAVDSSTRIARKIKNVVSEEYLR